MTRADQATASHVPDVTVVVAAFDGMPYVTRCIESVFAQTLGMDRIQLIAVDDGSGDGTGEELERLAAQCPTMQVVHQANSGSPAQPRNVGLGLATGRYVFFLDADDYLGAEGLQRMVAYGDANGSDMVLGRLVGIGGRKAPKSVFRCNQPRADLFKSRVFWSLNPMKLFRRGHIETLGLRFATDLPWGEDMPFVLESYLNASVISILADYDCVYLTYRDDGNNFTKRVSSATSRLATPTRLLRMIERYVGPGRKRDYLMTRIFQLEVINILPRIAQETDPVAQREAFETVKDWADRWYTRPIAYRLSPLHRISLNLVRRGMLPEVLALFPEWPPTKNWGVIVDGKRVFADYPYFRDPAPAVPDECFEITRRLSAHCHVDGVTWTGAGVTIAGFAYIDMIDTVGMETLIVLRRRGGGAEYTVPTTAEPREGIGSDEWNRHLPRENAGFEASFDPATAANGGRLPAGWWDLSVRCTSEGVTREAPFGSVSCAAGKGPAAFNDLVLRQIPEAVAPGDESPVLAESVSWSTKDGSVLEIAGRCDASAEPAALSVVMLRRDGGQHRVKLDVAGGRFKATIPLRSIDEGGPIANGTWDVVLERREGDLSSVQTIPVGREPRVTYKWRGLWPTRTRIAAPAARLVLTSERIDPARMLVRARKMLRLIRSVFGMRT